MNTHVLENECLRVTVADRGAELVSVFDKETKTERIWNADVSVWNRHAPILFPFVGKVVNGKYRYNGKEYSMETQHGFARDMDFSCEEENEVRVKHQLVSSEKTREIYPFDFKLTVEHCLSSERPEALLISWTIENTGMEKMYYSIGGHPGFMPPKGVKKEDCFIAFPGRDELYYFGADSEGFALPQNRKHLALENGRIKYQEDIPDTWIFEEQNIDRVEIAGPDQKAFVTMECKGFPMLAVWANKNGPFICLEPWFGRTDDAGFAGSMEQKSGMQVLERGKKSRISYTMEFHRVGTNSFG